MDAPERKRRGPLTLFMTSRHFRRRAIGTIIVVPVLYVLSVGPACWATAVTEAEYQATGQTGAHLPFMRIYVPLGKVLESDGRCAKILEWWMMFGLTSDQMAWLPTTMNGVWSIGVDGPKE